MYFFTYISGIRKKINHNYQGEDKPAQHLQFFIIEIFI